MRNEFITKVVQIGKSDTCTQSELYYFLPFYPNIRGSELIFSRSLRVIIRHADSDNFIKGLHLIEMRYRQISGQKNFGSPSVTYDLINRLKRTDAHRAKMLTEWIAFKGGNYYIPENSSC